MFLACVSCFLESQCVCTKGFYLPVNAKPGGRSNACRAFKNVTIAAQKLSTSAHFCIIPMRSSTRLHVADCAVQSLRNTEGQFRVGQNRRAKEQGTKTRDWVSDRGQKLNFAFHSVVVCPTSLTPPILAPLPPVRRRHSRRTTSCHRSRVAKYTPVPLSLPTPRSLLSSLGPTTLPGPIIGPWSNQIQLLVSVKEGKPHSVSRSPRCVQNSSISAKNPGRFGRARGKQEGIRRGCSSKHLAWDAIETCPLHSKTCDRGMSCSKSTMRVQQHCFRTCK